MSMCIKVMSFSGVCKPFREKGNYVPFARSAVMMQVKILSGNHRQFLKIWSVFSRRVGTDNEMLFFLVIKLPITS